MDIQKIREDFPILSRTVYGKPLVYFVPNHIIPFLS